MSSTQDTKTVSKAESATNENKTCCKEDKSCDKKKCTVENKECCKLWNFFRSKFFYFLLASGSVVSSYLVWRRFYKKH